ncbi:uncharacterized protein KY384_007339 [Bacidia gigantensis]|uniref:uncharacterized protein n=1 Tax=Bacidia gigantensis TaxID=2732470 RepID=UPI001D04E86D|nr:uncharacterized protein KY384_007339 [Bacidia gigantensis]KAG8528421.1 hypothetical protein KY384_007339 [Bacidia gigantensis]
MPKTLGSDRHNLQLELLEQVLLYLDTDDMYLSCEDLFAFSLTNRYYNQITTPYLTTRLNIVIKRITNPPWIVFPDAIISGVPFPPHHLQILIQMSDYIDSILCPDFTPNVPVQFQTWVFRKTAPQGPYLLPCEDPNDFRWMCHLTYKTKFDILNRYMSDKGRKGWIEGMPKKSILPHDFTAAMCIELKEEAKSTNFVLRYRKDLNAIEILHDLQTLYDPAMADDIFQLADDLFALSTANRRCWKFTAPYLSEFLDTMIFDICVGYPPWFKPTIPQSSKAAVNQLYEFVSKIHALPQRFRSWAVRKTAPTEPFHLPATRPDELLFTFQGSGRWTSVLYKGAKTGSGEQNALGYQLLLRDIIWQGYLAEASWELCSQLEAVCNVLMIKTRGKGTEQQLIVSTVETDEKFAEDHVVTEVGEVDIIN